MANVFISYVEEDRAVAVRLAHGIESAGFSTWYYERDCVPGPSYLVQTGEAVARADAFILLVSPTSLGSHQITREVVRAHECNRAFVPVLWGVSHSEFQARQPEWREALGAATSVDLSNTHMDDATQRVIAGLRALGVSPDARPTPALIDVHSARAANSRQALPHYLRRVVVAALLLLILLGGIGVVLRFAVLGGFSPPSQVSQPDLRAPGSAVVPTTRDSTYPSIAVLEFDNNTPDKSMDVWKKGLREFMATDLTALPGVRVVERGRLQDMLAELALAESAFIDSTTAVRVGRGLSAHWVVTGSYAMVGENLRLDIRLISVARGTVDFASSVDGRPADIVVLQRTLLDRLAGAIHISESPSPLLTVMRGPAPSLPGFLRFSEALSARAAGDRAKARDRLRDAIKSDPLFPLAQAEISSIETEAATVIADMARLGRANASDAAVFLRGDVRKRYDNVSRRAYDGHYFADLLVISAQMGLFGDHERELAYLMQFWRDLSGRIPAESLDQVMAVVNADIEAAGRDFEKHIDSGHYDDVPDRGSPGQTWLKPGLFPDIQWPMYATFWPFSRRLRFAARQIRLADDAEERARRSATFSKRMPSTPLDYLHAIANDVSEHRAGRFGYHFMPERGVVDFTCTEYQSVVSTRLSLLQYYSQHPPRLPAAQTQIAKLESSLVHAFEMRLPLEKVRDDVLVQALRVFPIVAASNVNGTLGAKAADITLQVSRQLRINAGHASDATTPIEFIGVKLESANVVFVLCSGALESWLPDRFVTDHLVRAMRGIGAATKFNMVLARGVTSSMSTALADSMIAGSAANVARSIDFVRQQRGRTQPGYAGKPRLVALEERLGEIMRSLPDHAECDIVIVALGRDHTPESVSQSFIEWVTANYAHRTHVHAFLRQPISSIGRLVAVTGGTATIVDISDSTREPLMSRWDVSGLKAEGTPTSQRTGDTVP